MTLFLNAYMRTGDISVISASAIQNEENADVWGVLASGESGQTLHFFERLEKTIRLSMSQDVVQANEDSEIYAKVRNENGSIIGDEHRVYFFEKYSENLKLSVNDPIIQTNDNTEIYAKIRDIDGSVINTAHTIHFFKKED